MSNKLIRSLLQSRLNTWATAKPIPVAWDNVKFTTPTGSYIRASLLPADTQSIDLEGAHRGYMGLFQLSVHVPLGTGPGQAETLAEELSVLFPMALRLESGAFWVQITSPCSQYPGLTGETHYMVPVRFKYRADT